MKTLLTLSTLLFSFTLIAQPHSSEKDHPRHEKMHADLTPEQITELRMKELTLFLDLSESQKQKISKLELEVAKDRKAMNEKRIAQEKLTETNMFKHRSEQLDKQIAYKNSIRSILSETQFDKWEKSQENAAGIGYHGKYHKDKSRKRLQN